MSFLKVVLLPLSSLYGVVTTVRNKLYDKGILKSTSFDIPIISIGNLTVGGTGKTPHIEYLIRLIKSEHSVATLSRGYGRKTKGFLLAGPETTSAEIGDEPAQYASKFSDIPVAVCENRVKGVENLRNLIPDLEVILLDDAYQHRRIKPGLNILLTEYGKIFTDNLLLPSGTLREPVKQKRRADIIVITKSPSILSPMERRRIQSKIKPLPHQKLYFSYLKYGEFMPTWEVNESVSISKDYYFERNFSIVLVTGIANPDPISNYLKERSKEIKLISFRDHHEFTADDFSKIEQTFNEMRNPNKIIVTTEKDWMRMKGKAIEEQAKKLKMFFLPIEVEFHENDKQCFDNRIVDFINEFPKK